MTLLELREKFFDGFRIVESPLLPYESQQDDGSTLRTDYVLDRVNRTLVCSPQVVRSLQSLGVHT